MCSRQEHLLVICEGVIRPAGTHVYVEHGLTTYIFVSALAHLIETQKRHCTG